MKNEQMTYDDLKLLEKDLHRELTNEEALLGYKSGYKALLTSLGLDDEKYVAYRRLLELLITYYTKDEFEFITLYNSKDYTSAITLLSEFVDTIAESSDKKVEPFTLDEESLENKDPFELTKEAGSVVYDESLYRNGGLTEQEVIDHILSQIPESEHKWMTYYEEIDPEKEAVSKFISELYHDDEAHDIDESIGDVLDVIKDTVIDRLVFRLSDGESFVLPDEILDEVIDYIEENWSNYSMRIVNNKIEVKKL